MDGDDEKAARLLAFADAVRAAEGSAWWPAEKADRERYTALARSQLDPAAWDKATAEGRAMPPERAIRDAQEVGPSPTRATA